MKIRTYTNKVHGINGKRANPVKDFCGSNTENERSIAVTNRFVHHFIYRYAELSKNTNVRYLGRLQELSHIASEPISTVTSSNGVHMV